MKQVTKNALIIWGFIWGIMGALLILRGIGSLLGELSTSYLWLLIAVALGLIKGLRILLPLALRLIERMYQLEDITKNLYLGWLYILHKKELILIGVMFLLIITLRYLDSIFDIDLILGLIRFAVGIALLIGCLGFWREIQKIAKVD